MRQNGKAGHNAMPSRPTFANLPQLRGAAWSMALLMPPQYWVLQPSMLIDTVKHAGYHATLHSEIFRTTGVQVI